MICESSDTPYILPRHGDAMTDSPGLRGWIIDRCAVSLSSLVSGRAFAFSTGVFLMTYQRLTRSPAIFYCAVKLFALGAMAMPLAGCGWNPAGAAGHDA